MESAIVNLKAELYKKRLNVSSSEIEPKNLKFLKLRGESVSIKTKGVVKTNKQPDIPATDTEENLKLKKSKSMLEKKALLYDKIKKGTDILDDDELNDKFLINFQKKIVNEVTELKKDREQLNSVKILPELLHPAQKENDKWIEYIDEFGRTRVCMQKDLPEFVQQNMEKRMQEKAEENLNEKHAKWNAIEEESCKKDTIHYNDVLYDEARTHGVAFMPFSRDESERKAQHDLLTDLRTETKKTTNSNILEAKKKKDLMQERLRKVRQRKRLKAGLPVKDFNEELLKTPPASDEESAIEENVSSIELPKEPPNITEKYEKPKKVREWDLGKPGVNELLTQEQWVENRRKIRDNEFAPLNIYSGQSSGKTNNNKQSSFNNLPKRFASTSKSSFKNQDDDSPERNEQEDSCHKRNNTFAPPATYEYYGPSGVGKRGQNKIKLGSMEAAISKGLSNLRKQS